MFLIKVVCKTVPGGSDMGNSAEKLDVHTETRKVATSRFGEIEIDYDKLITMTSSFLGFPDNRLFVLLPHSENSPFFWLQSLEDPELAFIVIQPDLITADYKPAIPSAIYDELEISSDGEVEYMVTLTIPPGKPEDITANLLGPVAFNAEKRLARQVVLDPKKYDSCWPVQLH